MKWKQRTSSTVGWKLLGKSYNIQALPLTQFHLLSALLSLEANIHKETDQFESDRF